MARRVEPNHPDCPPETPVALVNDATGVDIVEDCYTDEASATEAMDAADASDAGARGATVDTFAAGPADPVIAEMYGAHALPLEAYSEGNWEGVLALEGTPSGDRREFDPGALEWRDLPIPMNWQMMTAPEHEQAVVVGRVDELWREGTDIRARGVFDMAGQNGMEAHRLVHGGFIRGQSISLDDVADNDVEFIFPDPGTTDPEADPMAELFAEPEKILFHHGRIVDTLLTGQPAFQEAFISLIPDAQFAATGAPTGGPKPKAAPFPPKKNARVIPHQSPIGDGAWNGDAMFANMPITITPEYAQLTFGWVDWSAVENGEMSKHAGQLLHHHVTPSGMPSAANLTAVASALARLNGAQGGVNIPDEERRGVYDHLAQHLIDAGQTPPPLASLNEVRELRALTASVIAVNPPEAWFRDPKLSGVMPWTVRDDGESIGHLALWHTCHTAFTGQCVVPPRENEFAYFTTGEIVAREGSRWPIGQLTFGTNHAPGHLSMQPAVEHYEHTGFVAADVACGADKYGIWVHGAVRPGLTDAQLRSLRAAAISGDWRRIGGKLRLVAGLLVNVPGFPIPRTRTYVHDGAQSALVASGIVRGRRPRVESAIAHRIAASIGRDPASRRAQLQSRVHGQ